MKDKIEKAYVAVQAREAWIKYKVNAEHNYPGTDFRDGYAQGYEEGLKHALKLVAEAVSPGVSNEIEQLINNC